MRVALFHNLPSGGAKRSVCERVKRLSAHHTLDLFSLTCADTSFADLGPWINQTTLAPFERSRLFSSPFGRLNQAIRVFDIRRLKQEMKGLARKIDQGGYDIVMVEPCMFTFSPMVLQYLKTPSLYYRHDPIRWLHDPAIPRVYDHERSYRKAIDRVDPLRRAYFQILQDEDKKSMEAATRVLTNSFFTRESVYRLYGRAPFVNYLGVDAELFQPRNLVREKFVISVGAVLPNKGFDFIIEALGCIPPQERPNLVIVGNSAIVDEREYLQTLAQENDVRVDFFAS